VEQSTLNAVDIVAFVAIAIGVWQGFRRRLSGELAGLISSAVALLAGLLLCRPIGDALLANTRLGPEAARTLGFVLAATTAGILMVVLRFVLKGVMQIVVEETTDKIAGCIAGAVRMTVIVLIAFLIMNLVPHDYLNRLFGEESLIGRGVLRGVPVIRDKIESHEGLREHAERARERAESIRPRGNHEARR